MNHLNAPLNRKLRMALIGGGGNAFIGRVHALSAQLDNRAELVAGALSSDARRAREAAPEFGIPPNRAYESYQQLLEKERELDESQRIDFVSIATPNFTHFPIAKAALKAGFDVVCDKPLTLDLSSAIQLADMQKETGRVFAVTHNYSGYPMVRQAREMVQAGELGELLAVRVSYIQGWLHGLTPGKTPDRGAWKLDPKKAGAGALGDIGTHAFHLMRYVTRCEPRELSATVNSFSDARELDDYGHVIVRLSSDALALITFSQVTHGRLNDLTLEVDGTQGALQWRQESPNELTVRRLGKPVQIYERHPRAEYLHDACRIASRIPGGHPEAFFEAFANVYRDAFDDMVLRKSGQALSSETTYPNVNDGVEGVQFIERTLQSNAERGRWLPFS